MGQRQGEETLRRPRAGVRHLSLSLILTKLQQKHVGKLTFFFLLFSRYYEWLKKGAQRVPHFTRHKDKRLMLFAGLYDSATLDGESFHFRTKPSYTVRSGRTRGELTCPAHRSCEWNARF